MHYIQKRILDDLRTSDSMKYVELNAYKVESGHFRYHLQQLVKDGYINSTSRGVYTLTNDGKSLVDKLSRGTTIAKSTPKVITYILLEDNENVYLQKKDRDPYRNLLNMIGGKVHEAETTLEASKRELEEKLGYQITTHLKHRGVFEILIELNDELFTHVIAFVYSSVVTEKPNGTIQIKKNDLSHKQGLAPDFMKIYERISNDMSPVFETLRISIS